MSVDLAGFQKLCEEMYLKKSECDALDQRYKDQSKQLEALKAKVLAHMEQSEIEKFNVNNYGSIYIRETSSVTVPSNPTDRDLFFGYLRERGIFEEAITVHSQKLNSLYKSFLEEAVEAGNAEFKVPGLKEPTFRKTLVLRSK